jgi:hypothetical protein
MSFGILSGMLGGVFRSGYEDAVGLVARYTSYSMLSALGFFLIAYDLTPQKKKTLFFSVAVLLVLMSSIDGIPQLQRHMAQTERAKRALTHIIKTGDFTYFEAVHPSKETIKHLLAQANEAKIDMRPFIEDGPENMIKEQTTSPDLSDLETLRIRWEEENGKKVVSTRDGFLIFNCDLGKAAFVSQKLKMNARKDQAILVRFDKIPDQTSTFKIFWTTNKSENWDNSKSVKIVGAIPNVTYKVKVPMNGNWKDTITKIRIIPSDSRKETIVLKKFDILISPTIRTN